MGGWGTPDTARYLRFVFTNEPCERLRGIGSGSAGPWPEPYS